MADGNAAGGLEPVEEGCLEMIGGVAVVALGVVGFIYILGGTPTRTAGATRSTRLQMELRQQQIEQVIEQGRLQESAEHEISGI
jgi:hypothetical protein